MLRQEKGITLIALVITIIVLLILAGVTIAMLSGENGILTRASESADMTQITNAQDIISISVSEEMTEYYNKKYVDSTSTETTATTAAEAVTAGANAVISSGKVTGTDVEASVSGATITLTYNGYTSTATASGNSLIWSTPTKTAE